MLTHDEGKNICTMCEKQLKDLICNAQVYEKMLLIVAEVKVM